MKLPVPTHIRAALGLLVFCQILLFLVSRNPLSVDASTPLASPPAASALLTGCATPSFAPAMGSPVSVGGDPHFVGVGDFNGDNHLDIVTTEYDDDKVRILLGNGSGQFTTAPQSPIPAGDQPVATAIGDFNGDNKADIAVTNQLSHNITILLGNGDGTFAQAANSPVAVGNAPRGIAHGYFNGDAHLDLAVCNGGSDNISILLGNGNGTFTQAAGSPIMAQDAPFHVVTGFFDADANADLAVANLGTGTVAIFLGNGSGGFAPSGSPISVGSFTSFLALADFNGDGKQDLAATNRLSNNVVILLGNGAGAFSQAMGSPYTVGTAPMAVNAGDVNIDGKIDLVVANETTANVAVLLGNGTGGFSPATFLSKGMFPTHVALADFNEDNRLDLANADGGDNTITVLLNTCTACAPITVSPSGLGNGTVNTPFSQSFSATGGLAPYTFSLMGTLPTGLNFTGGTLSGTPTQTGSFPLTVTATDNVNCAGNRNYTLVVNCQTISLLPASLPNGAVGTPYNQQLTASNTIGTVTWSSTGTLPNNLSLDASTGVLSGSPTVSGSFTFNITATDQNNCQATKQYTVVICGAIAVNPATAANGFVGTAYSQTFTQTGGVGTVTWSSTGTLPNGLSLNPTTGELSGLPTNTGTFNFAIRATDQNGCFGERSYSVIISSSGLQFYPLAKPIRLLDTRGGQGNCDNVNAPIAAGGSITTLARTTCEGITIPAAAQAIVGNITVINQSAQAGFLTLYPTGVTLPLAANMIYGPNGILANNFTVGLSANGEFNIFGERTIDVIVDVSGYFAPPGAGGLYYHPLSKPIRLTDTRPAQGNCDSVSTPIAAGTSLTTLARTTCEGLTIPAAAQAIVGNATVINQSGQTGYLTIYPDGVAAPLAANMVYFPGNILSNAFTVGLSNDGRFNIFGEKTIDMIVDVAGYYSTEANDVNGVGLLFNPLSRPLRILDTRAAQGNCDSVAAPIAGGTSISAPARLTCESLTIPATAQTVLGNVTVINQTAQAGFLTLYPDGVTLPLAANMIYFPGQVLSNAFVVGLNAGTGQYRIFAERTLEAIVDVSGYFAP